MPISPDKKALYPAPREWKIIRAAILERAGHKCEQCGAENYAVGYREKDGTFVPISDEALHNGVAEADNLKLLQIVLTISHTDHDPTNNDPSNLRALCQRDHLLHDKHLHARNAAVTRRVRREAAGQPALLEAQP